MDKMLIYKILATMMVMEPDTEVARLVVEFAERKASKDLEACWTDEETVKKIEGAQKELLSWQSQHEGNIESMAESMDKYFNG